MLLWLALRIRKHKRYANRIPCRLNGNPARARLVPSLSHGRSPGLGSHQEHGRVDMHGPGCNGENGLVLLTAFRTGNQLQQTFVKANSRIHVDAPFLQVQLDAGEVEFPKSFLRPWREFRNLLTTPPDTRENKNPEDKFKSNGHAKFLLGNSVREPKIIAIIPVRLFAYFLCLFATHWQHGELRIGSHEVTSRLLLLSPPGFSTDFLEEACQHVVKFPRLLGVLAGKIAGFGQVFREVE